MKWGLEKMTDWINEEVIRRIQRKLCNGERLEDFEIKCCMTALRKAGDCKQVPFYEVVYHDEYDRQEHRIMEPVDISYKDDGHIRMRRDRFELYFNRIL